MRNIKSSLKTEFWPVTFPLEMVFHIQGKIIMFKLNMLKKKTF